MSMKVVTVQITAELIVNFPDDIKDSTIRFIVEENSCPGTDRVGAELENVIKEAREKSVCWACGRNGVNKVLSIDKT